MVANGNCYILETKTSKLILDAGIHMKEVEKALNFDFTDVVGCLITHEHQDHLKYFSDFLKKGINIYASEGTLQCTNVKHHRFKTVKAQQQFNIVADFTILPFKTQHDAKDPLGFLIQYNPTGERLLYATDTYYLKYKFNKLNYLLIECNYNKLVAKHNSTIKVIGKARYTRLLESHMSLDALIKFLEMNDLSNVKKIMLCHLSDTNADEKVMQNTIQSKFKIDTEIATNGKLIDLDIYPF